MFVLVLLTQVDRMKEKRLTKILQGSNQTRNTDMQFMKVPGGYLLVEASRLIE